MTTTTMNIKPLHYLVPGILECTVEPLEEATIAAVLRVLQKHYDAGIDPGQLTPPDDPVALREDLHHEAPQLFNLGNACRTLLEADNSALVIRSFGLSDRPLRERSAILFAFSACIGIPTATDKIDRRVVWDVKVREGKSATTFSEHSDEADLHTDAQYFPQPERYMMLYVVSSARCGGGISTLRDLRCIRSGLQESSEGRWARAHLVDRELPFRVPGVFTETGGADKLEVTFAPIFSTRPAIRFRSDTLKKGLALHPVLDTPELRRAIGILERELAKKEKLFSMHMPADSLQIVNNHEALHGRTPFSDHQRHVLRVRMAES